MSGYKREISLAATTIVLGKVYFKGSWRSVIMDGGNFMICDYINGNFMNIVSFLPLPQSLKSFESQIGTSLLYALTNKFISNTSPFGDTMLTNFFYSMGLSALSAGIIEPIADRVTGMINTNVSGTHFY